MPKGPCADSGIQVASLVVIPVGAQGNGTMFKVPQNLLQDFKQDTRGAIAILFSLSLVVVITTVGLAVDVSRGVRVGTTIGAAADAAVLAGAKGLRLQNMTDAQVTALVQTMFDENVKASGFDIPTINAFTVTINRADSSVELNVDAEIPTVLGQLAGVHKLSLPRRSVAIYEQKDIEVALQLDVTGSMSGGKLAALKTATKDLIDILIPDDLTLLAGQKVRIGYAPCAAGINAGPYASAINGGVSAPNNCVYERANTSNQATENFPAGASVLKTKLDLPSSNNCSGAQVLPMTSDKSLLKTTVDSYWTNGSTAGHLGTAFAWYLLSPQWATIWPAASQPVAYNTGNTAKIAILMTDGEYNTVGGSYNGSNVSKSQNFAKDTCAAMKAQGIRVYTVGFKLKQANATETLTTCASDSSKFYPAEDADGLRLAFQAIAQDIATLRISE
ncbi:MAG: Flp pilus assembly protein TadG [Hyphomicrobiaceae bacterium]